MADQAQDRKLPASERRIRKARLEGQVARSRDLVHFCVLAAGLALFAYGAGGAVLSSAKVLRSGLRFDAAVLADPTSMLAQLGHLGLPMLGLLLPALALLWMLGALGSVASGGWNFTWQPLQPQFSKINPMTGLARVFSLRQLGDTAKACLLALLLGGVGVLVLRSRWAEFAQLLALSLPMAVPQAGHLVLVALLPLAAVLAVFAVVDVPLQRAKLMKSLRMSMAEAKQEMKELEGNPQVKSVVRARMREMSNRRMMAAVPTADLVVMNPSHYAVALKYDDKTMAAPRVVAKGADLVALRIRDLAKTSGVPVLQAPALARALYAHTRLDQEIPTRLFAAVAQVLTWVFRLREAARTGQPLRGQAPQPAVPADLDPANETNNTNTRAAPSPRFDA